MSELDPVRLHKRYIQRWQKSDDCAEKWSDRVSRVDDLNQDIKGEVNPRVMKRLRRSYVTRSVARMLVEEEKRKARPRARRRVLR